VIEYRSPLGVTKVPGPRDSLRPLYRLRESARYFAADTETTGLNMYKADFRVRIVQVGTRDEAWILNPQYHMKAIADLTQRGQVWWHNWVFDGLSMEESLGLDFDDTFGSAHDTDIVSRLIDPRPPMKGGVGHKLKDLGDKFVMRGVKDSRSEVLAECKRLFGARQCTVSNMWRQIPIDNEVYLRYAGQDVHLTARLAELLEEKLHAKGLDRFYQFERPLSRRLAEMQRVGTAFDPAWAAAVEQEYDDLFSKWERLLVSDWQIEQTATYAHTSKKALQQRFAELGVRWTKKTPGGQDSLDKGVLQELAQSDHSGDIRDLATAVLTAKQNKHYGDYVRGMRDKLGKDGRIHPNIRPMQAATHRMSISDPPIQQFPRGDPRVRGCLIADEGEVILTADYAQIEFRVAAAVSRDPVMKRRIINGEDLHRVTAEALFGPAFNADQRQASKPIGFGRLYLGSAKGIRNGMVESDTTGYVPPLNKVRSAIKAFDRDYRVYYQYAMGLKGRVERDGGRLVTSTGRHLIVSPTYAAPNYEIQSSARDIFAHGINAAHRNGIGQHLRLVVHDELVLSVPTARAQEIGSIVEESMSTMFKGIPIAVEWKVKGARWAK
jgi:DNA polymerase I-like protein with 3'-5' exonuclease and polymerase domains